jgi:8-oxo-dGTP diphosphatase
MENRRYPNYPLVGVGAVVIRGAEILMIKRGKPPREGSWSLPGGLQELGETVHEAAAREVMEETGIRITNIALLDVINSIHHDEKGEVEYHYTLVDVAAEWVAGDPVGGSDAADARWFRQSIINEMDIWPETKRIIEMALSRI